MFDKMSQGDGVSLMQLYFCCCISEIITKEKNYKNTYEKNYIYTQEREKNETFGILLNYFGYDVLICS